MKKYQIDLFDVFQHIFYLDPPTLDTSKRFYDNLSRNNIKVLYSKPFFEFLNEIHHNENSIYNDQSYEIVKNASIAQFLSEEDYLRQKNRPPPKFNGFDIVLSFRNHQNAENIFNTKNFYESFKKYKLQVYQNTNKLNQNLINEIERSFNNTKLLDNEPIEDVFKIDDSTHRSHELSSSAEAHYYIKEVHQCFINVIDTLNKCKAQSFSDELDSIDYLQNFAVIQDYGSNSASYSMLTQLFDLLTNDFVSSKTNLGKNYKNRIVSYNDIYKLMIIVAQLASPNIGNLNNLPKLCGLNEKKFLKKYPVGMIIYLIISLKMEISTKFYYA